MEFLNEENLTLEGRSWKWRTTETHTVKADTCNCEQVPSMKAECFASPFLTSSKILEGKRARGLGNIALEAEWASECVRQASSITTWVLIIKEVLVTRCTLSYWCCLTYDKRAAWTQQAYLQRVPKSSSSVFTWKGKSKILWEFTLETHYFILFCISEWH